MADCLNARGFLVEQHANVVRGSSAGGVNFTLTIYRAAGSARRAFAALDSDDAALLGAGVVEFAGNPPATPGGAPGRLGRGALSTIRLCLDHP